jgi:hypothetical protein
VKLTVDEPVFADAGVAKASSVTMATAVGARNRRWER